MDHPLRVHKLSEPGLCPPPTDDPAPAADTNTEPTPPRRHHLAEPVPVTLPARAMSLVFTVILDSAGFAAALGNTTARPGGPRIRLCIANPKGRVLTATLRPKQVLRALAEIARHGASNVGLRLEGTRGAGNVMHDAVLRALVNPASVPKPVSWRSAKPVPVSPLTPPKTAEETQNEMAAILLSLWNDEPNVDDR
jgi:hypothetical protein